MNTATQEMSTGSQTIPVEPVSLPPQATLHLRADPSTSRQVRWVEDVVDNENLGRKKSKICCIFHKNRQFGESSSEESSSSSDSDSDSDSSCDGGASSGDHGAIGGPSGANEGNSCKHSSRHRRKKRSSRDSSPNAYERQPNYSKSSKESKEQD